MSLSMVIIFVHIQATIQQQANLSSEKYDIRSITVRIYSLQLLKAPNS